MSAPLLTVSTSPHILGRTTVRQMHLEFLIALAPTLLAGFYYFGTPAVVLVVLSAATALVVEWAIAKVCGLPNRVDDLHAVLMGVLLGMLLPAGAPWWVAVVGAVLAIAMAKMIFGGLGGYPMNPVLIAWATLEISWPEHMKAFLMPLASKPEMAQSALMKLQADPSVIKTLDLMGLWCGTDPGELGCTSAWAILIGGLYLIIRRHIDWRIPLGVMVGVIVMSLLALSLDPNLAKLGLTGLWQKLHLAWFHLGSGGMMIAAFFLATESVSSPVTPGGCLLYGLGIGILAVIIRSWGAAGDGAYYAVLLMSAATPLFDRVRPRVIGKPQREW